MAPGLTGIVGGRPTVWPKIRLFSCLVQKSKLALSVIMDGNTEHLSVDTNNHYKPQPSPKIKRAQLQTDTTVPLISLAYARSGDKGNHANIGAIARKPEYLPFIKAALTEEAIADFMAHTLDPATGKVSGWELDGFHAVNFLLENSLGGGGVASLRIDPQGKAFAQQLLEFPIPVPQQIANSLKV
jgi:hypothetical protein